MKYASLVVLLIFVFGMYAMEKQEKEETPPFFRNPAYRALLEKQKQDIATLMALLDELHANKTIKPSDQSLRTMSWRKALRN